MKRFAKLLLVTLGFGTLAFLPSLVPQKSANAEEEEHNVKNVIVANTPLPVTGDINATITASSPVPVQAVDSPARQPFQASVGVNIADGSFFSGDITGFSVPRGKRLILETATFDIQLPSPQQVIAPEVRVTGAGATVEFPVVVQTEGTIPVLVNGQAQNQTQYSGSQHISFVADSGTDVFFSVVRSANSQAVTGIFNVAGYLVDTP